ncbi:hypothetical protein SAMN05444156_1215 [Verrucomicrobium sp. GAS474]|uniref:hypothetical protein n=1 Tax=Verrucomicrobium sp. GAS474 TaxID=1882831 RepID=UPI000879D7E3|nr:hypothetical protein [Verrucomicrobium sp. GAS474]SDT97887.1 hypothetical protein SAMN05444156_1215 [Verrucomicrobium sp. GAS474]
MKNPRQAKAFKFVVGLLLLPLLAAALLALGDLSRFFWHDRAWGQYWFWALGGGFALWLVVYFALPRPMWLYVFGHELTHALAVYLHAGEVYKFHVSKRGGHVITDKTSWFISLSPYFIPLYTVFLLALWLLAAFYWKPLAHYLAFLYLGIGITWGFHLTFTVSMIGEGQQDLKGEGVFFSLVVILLLNLLLIEIGLTGILGGWHGFPRMGLGLWHHALDAYAWTGKTLWTGALWVWTELVALVRHAKG